MTPAAALCTIQKRAEPPVAMEDMPPLVHVSVNGTDALRLADSASRRKLPGQMIRVTFDTLLGARRHWRQRRAA
jgi:hypothetical protein